MSDAGVREAIERMEAWLEAPGQMPGPEVLEAWNQAFREALAGAERGPGWEALVARAQSLGPRIEARTAALVAERDALRRELGVQARGDRALKGYGASTR